MKKINSFTLMEVTVAMLIGVISIGIAYSALNLVGRSFAEYNSRNKRISELTLTNRLLNTDFANALRITRTEQGMDFKFAEGSVNYVFEKDYILRDQYQLHTDTLHVNAGNFKIQFEHADSQSGDLVDNLLIQTKSEGEPITLSYFKLYSSENLFK